MNEQIQMSRDELLSLPVSTDLATAGRAFGLGRTKAFELAKAGEFPCPVLRVGMKYRVPRSAIFEALAFDPVKAERERRVALATESAGVSDEDDDRKPQPAA
jgi:hypothetical protein